MAFELAKEAYEGTESEIVSARILAALQWRLPNLASKKRPDKIANLAN
jgi:hypothetical protein